MEQGSEFMGIPYKEIEGMQDDGTISFRDYSLLYGDGGYHTAKTPPDKPNYIDHPEYGQVVLLKGGKK